MANGGGAYWGGAPNALVGGMEFAADQIRQRKKDAALNALIERFGPEAANSAAWSQLQTIDQREKLFPHTLGAAERETAANEALVDKYGPVAGSPTAIASQDSMQGALRMAATGGAMALQAARNRGADMGQAFDRTTKLLEAMGYSPDTIAQMRDAVLQDPAALDEFIAMLQGVSQGQTGMRRAIGQPIPVEMEDGSYKLLQNYTDGSHEVLDYTPAGTQLAEGRLGVSQRRTDLTERGMRGEHAPTGFAFDPEGNVMEGTLTASPIPGTTQARTISEEDANKVSNAEAMIQMSEIGGKAVQDAIDALREVPQGAGPIGATGRMLGQFVIPGSDTKQYLGELKQVLSQVAIDRLKNIKASGATLGQISEKELQMLQDSLGALDDMNRDPAKILEDLLTIQRILFRGADGAREFLRQMEQVGTQQSQPQGTQGGAGRSPAVTQIPQSGGAPPSAPRGGGAPPPGIAAPQAPPLRTGTTWQARAAQLRGLGWSNEAILAQMRKDGLIR